MSTARAPRLGPEKLRELARGIVEGTHYCVNEAAAIRDSFGLVIMALDPATDLVDVGAFYEEFAKSGPTGINGRPFFTSCRFLHKDDLQPLIDAIAAYEKQRAEFVEGATT